MQSENSRADRRCGNRSFERLLVVAEAHHPTPCMLLTANTGSPDELGHDIGRSAEGLIVEHGHIFLDRPAGRFWRQPLLTLDPFLPIGIRLDQTGIDREGFAADQSLADAALQNRLKDAS